MWQRGEKNKCFRFSSPREVSGKYSIVKDEDSAHLARSQIAHRYHHGIPEWKRMTQSKKSKGQFNQSFNTIPRKKEKGQAGVVTVESPANAFEEIKKFP